MEQLGGQVLWGWCYDEGGALPYWPWVQSIRSYIERATPEQLHKEMGPGAADIAEVVPEVREMLTSLSPLTHLEPEQARFRLFDSIVTFFKNASGSRSLMIVLDDLHWSDKPTLLLLEFMARQLGESSLLVVGAYRDVELSRQHPLSSSLALLAREPVFQRQFLRRFDREACRQLVYDAAGMEPAPELVDSVYSHSEGNPFFLTELIRLLSERGELTGERSQGVQAIRIPEGVREVIGQRLNGLSEQCNQALTIGSVVGREFSLELIDRLNDQLSGDRLLDVLEEALTARVIEELPQSVGRYQFSHALIQETLSGELSTTRRVRLHARIAQALEEIYEADADAHASELAYHFAEAEAVLGNENLVKYSSLAGERALAAYAWEEALSHFQRALSAKEDEPLDDQTAASLFGLAKAQSAILIRSQVGEVVASLNSVFDYYAGTGDIARAVAVAEHPFYPPTGHGYGASQLVAKALSLVPPDSLAAGRLLSRYGWFLTGEGNRQQAKEALDQALAIAQRENDIGLEMRTISILTRVEGLNRHPEQALRYGLRAIELAALSNEIQAEMTAQMWTSDALESVGDLEGARTHLEAALSLAEQLRDYNGLRMVLRRYAGISALAGDWSTALDFVDRGLIVAPGEYLLLAVRMMINYELGNFPEGDAILENLLDASRGRQSTFGAEQVVMMLTIPIISRITGIADRAATGQDEARFGTFFVGHEASAESLGLLAVMAKDAEGVKEHYVSLGSVRGRMIFFSNLAIQGSHLLGLFAQTMDNLDQATVHFEEALAFCRHAGYRPELAWTCCDYADCLVERKGVGDLARAKDMLDEAQAISSDLGMRPLMQRVLERMDQLEATPAGAPDYPDGLSPREVEVLALICIGKSNREIAEQLFISLSTVAHHVGNILNKTGVANRAEAATYAARHELAPK
jgi:DNA-binding CsgD family transcriptional regulator